MHEGGISCLGGNGGGRWDCELFPTVTGEGEYMGPGADKWIDVMVGNSLIGLFMFSSEK